MADPDASGRVPGSANDDGDGGDIDVEKGGFRFVESVPDGYLQSIADFRGSRRAAPGNQAEQSDHCRKKDRVSEFPKREDFMQEEIPKHSSDG